MHSAYAHSVAQVQTTKYLAPETVDLLLDRATNGNPGIQVGDIISYIIQFTPVANNALVGAGGYITDYIPLGTQVVDAAFVAPDGNNNFYNVGPNLPGPMPDGWGRRGEQIFAAPFNTFAYDTTGACASLLPSGDANKCNGRVADIYADTGIFYSTDPRTQVFISPDNDGVVRQGTNGYNIAPTARGQLNPIIGQNNATTHNLWDANSTNAFGSKQGDINGLAAPNSNQPALLLTKEGQGTTPFRSGSAVAGPDSGYPLDYTGTVGPWQRLSYFGSRAGCIPNCSPAADQDNGNAAAITGDYTLAGNSLPLPSSTNAVRWAAGALRVGELKYVKISLKILAPIPGSGLINNSEVFGGDSAQAAGKNGQDNSWRYHVPSVARTNSNLFVLKEVIRVNGQPANSSLIPAGEDVVLTYRITYLNTGNSTQNNVVLSDILPDATQGPPSNFVINSGDNILPITPANPGANDTFSFQSIPTLTPGGGGSVDFDLVVKADDEVAVINGADLVSDQIPDGVSSRVISVASNRASLHIAKTSNVAQVAPGGVVTYTIDISNEGSEIATDIVVFDFLPTSGSPQNASTRFNYANDTTSYTNIAGPANPAAVSPPTLNPFVGTNRQQLTWDLSSQTLTPGQSFSITFDAVVGADVPIDTDPYANDARVTYHDGDADNSSNAASTAPVQVLQPVPNIVIVKTAQTTVDPFGNLSNPKAIPGATVRYILNASNQGNGSPDSDSVALIDALPENTAFLLQDLSAPGTGPVQMTDGTPPSGLTYQYIDLNDAADSLEFSNDNGSTFTYSPVADANGADTNITHIRITLQNTFAANPGAAPPNFDLLFDVLVE